MLMSICYNILKKKGFDNIYSNTIYAMMLLIDPSSRGVHFRFGSVFIKKSNQTEFKKKKTKTGSNRPVSVRFGFLEQKPVWLGFFGLARFGWSLARFGSVFFWFFSVRVRFGSVFSVPGLKNWNRTEPVGVFKILISLISFFHGLIFSVICFPVFSV